LTQKKIRSQRRHFSGQVSAGTGSDWSISSGWMAASKKNRGRPTVEANQTKVGSPTSSPPAAYQSPSRSQTRGERSPVTTARVRASTSAEAVS
jgi:hypothetical protein